MSTGRHAAGASPANPAAAEPSLADRARTLVHLGRTGTLASLSRKHPGWPFGSLMPYAPDEQGQPLLLISSMAMHTHNVVADDRASLLIAQAEAAADPLAGSRVTLMGRVLPLEKEQVDPARQLYLARQPNARSWVDFEDFAFYRMQLTDLYMVAGFGVMGWVSAQEYAQAQPDPLADAAPAILAHMNSDHADALVLIARAAGFEADSAIMTSVDRLGFNLRYRAGERFHGARIAFLQPVSSVDQARKALVEMTRLARK